MPYPQFKFPPHEVMPPHSQCMKYGSKFPIMCGIINLVFCQFSQLIINFISILSKYSTKSFTWICTYHKIFIWVNNIYDWCT